MKWKIIYYETIKGKTPVKNFIDSVSDRQKAKIFQWLEYLEEKGAQLPRPFADILEDGIHELRIKLAGDQNRVLYFFCYRDFIILTHHFIKKTDKVPKKEINKAKKYRADFLSRYNEQKIRQVYNENI